MATASGSAASRPRSPSSSSGDSRATLDGEYLDVCGTKLTAAEVASTANRLANALGRARRGQGDRVATLIENSAEATLAWWGAVRAGAIAVPINTAYKGEYLRHQLADSGSRVLVVEADARRPGRGSGRTGGVARARGGDRRPRPRPDGGHHPRWVDLLEADDATARRRRAAVRPGHLHLHRRHDRPVQGLHAQPQLPRGADPPDRHLLGAHRRRRGVDAAAAVPLQRHHHRGARPAGVRRSGRHLPPLLGVELLAGDEPGRRHGHLHARHDGLPAGPRRRPPRDAEVGRTGGQHHPAAASARRRCRSRSTR